MTTTTFTAAEADLAHALDEVGRTVLEASTGGVPQADDVLRYLPSWTGKGTRPKVTLLAAATVACEAPAAVMAAAGIELIHLGTLHHDDVVDQSLARRGHPTVAAVWGNRTAVFAGTFLLARGTELVSEVGEHAARAAAACTAELCRGQTRELVATFRADRDKEDYLAVIGHKTGALFGLASLVGALVADAPTEVCAALERFGRTWGTAFQLADDIADLISTPDRRGKPVGQDVRAGVYTLPVILALETDGMAAARLRSKIGAPGLDPAEAEEVRELVAAAGGIEGSQVVLRGLLNRAHAQLDAVPDTWARGRLHDMVEDLADAF